MSESEPPKEAVKPEASSARKPPTITWGPIAAIVVSVLLYFGSQIIGSSILLVVGQLQGISGDQLNRWFEQTGPQFLYIASVEFITLSGLALFLHTRKAGFRTLGLVKPAWKDLAWALTGFGIYFPALIATTIAVKLWFPGIDLDQEQQIGFQAAHGFWPLLLVFVSLVVLPPVTEEIVTRGFLYLGLKSKLKRYWAIIITSAIFAIAHLQFGSGAPLLWSAAIDTFILSVILIYVREKTGALWASIGLHMIKNGLAFCTLFLFAK